MSAALEGRRVLVTGASGFIGSHLVRALAGTFAEVAAIVRGPTLSSRLGPPPVGVAAIRGDLRDPAVARAAALFRPEVVFHLAGVTRGREGEPAPGLEEELRATNVDATRALLHALADVRPAPLFVRTGSLLEFGGAAAPYDEDTRPEPASPYARSVLAATELVSELAPPLGVRAVTLRLALTYGPGRGPGSFVPDAIVAALARGEVVVRRPLDVRQPVHVDDVVVALLAAAELYGAGAGVPGGAPGHVAVNLAGPDRVTLRELAELIARATGARVGDAVPGDRDEPVEVTCGQGRAAALLGVRPRVSVAEGIPATVEWYRRAGGGPS